MDEWTDEAPRNPWDVGLEQLERAGDELGSLRTDVGALEGWMSRHHERLEELCSWAHKQHQAANQLEQIKWILVGLFLLLLWRLH